MSINAKQLHAQCWHYISQQAFSKAAVHAQTLVNYHPKNPEALYTLSYVYYGLKSFTQAIDLIDRALNTASSNGEFLVHKASCLLSLGRYSEALNLARLATESAANQAETLTRIGVIFQYCDEFEGFLNIAEKVYSLRPNDVSALSNYSDALRYVGRYHEAEKIINRLLTIAPDDASAHYAKSLIRQVNKDDNHIELMTESMKNTSAWRDQMKLSYALGKEFEDLGEHALAFQHFKAGGLLRRNHSTYHVNADIDAIAQIMQTYTKQNTEGGVAGYDNDEAIFVLGLPRSGTTLVERILSSHTEVISAGELRNFSSELISYVQALDSHKKLTRKEMIETSTQVNWQDLGKAYIASTRPKTGNTLRFIDKMPQNYLYIGLIVKALPKAKIILVKRDAMDSCYAMYKTLFGQAYPFTYSLEDIGHYYVAWRKLIAHWQHLYPNNIYTLNYEQLVADTEIQARELLSYCELPWQAECLEFYKNTAGVSTASASQVRQPIHSHSIGKWRHHRAQLQPLIKILTQAGIDVD